MTRIHLVLLWHMHQPQYRDPATYRYLLPWTRLHALKDYWGMVRLLEEFPGVHATFNMVPSLVAQLEEYASGDFDDPGLALALKPAEELEPEEKLALVERAFQVNRENLLARWPRYVELFRRFQAEGAEASAREFAARDWRDLQVLSQLAWMDEEYLARDPVVSELSRKGANFTEGEKAALRDKQLALLGRVLPEYRAAAGRGQVELSTTPFYHPILPLLCDTDVARIANPQTPLPQPPFRHPEDAREQLVRARRFHERVFGAPPAGLWPSEGSVSDQALELAAELGFRWFASDEGVLGRTLNLGFGRDATGVPAHAERLYAPLRVRRGRHEIVGLFRDHYLSDLIGFVYSRLDTVAAAEDLHRRIRALGERVRQSAPLTVSLILDGENAWEYYPANGRPFLREFYRRIAADTNIRALTASEAVAEAGEIPTVERIFPGSWINANFDIWMGHPEDVRAWELLGEARAFYAAAQKRRSEGQAGAPSDEQLAAAYEAVLAAEGSDWCWWYGPEHSTANDADFDALFRAHLTQVYLALGADAPEALAHPIKVRPAPAIRVVPSAPVTVEVDGRETSYFEWMGAGLYAAERRAGAMHGRSYFLEELHYGADERNFYLRVDPLPGALVRLDQCEFRFTLRGRTKARAADRTRTAPPVPREAPAAEGPQELRIIAEIERGVLLRLDVEKDGQKLTRPPVAAALDRIFELRISRELLPAGASESLWLNAAIWQGGLPMDLLPAEGFLEAQLHATPWP